MVCPPRERLHALGLVVNKCPPVFLIDRAPDPRERRGFPERVRLAALAPVLVGDEDLDRTARAPALRLLVVPHHEAAGDPLNLEDVRAVVVHDPSSAMANSRARLICCISSCLPPASGWWSRASRL